MTFKPELAAAIDLGTNTVLLLVAKSAAGKGLIVVTDECRTPRLGAGLAARGTLDPAARERAIEALAAFAFRLKILGVAPERTRVVGTAALRRAKDAAEFVAQVRARTGLSVEIIPAEEEARLGLGAISADGAGPETVIVDVGGGSTEIACSELDLRQSVPIGAVVLTEMFPSSKDFAKLADHARSELSAFPENLALKRPVLALGGTAVNLASLTLGLERFDAQKAEGARIDARGALRHAEELARMSVVARTAMPIETERTMILPAGLFCLGATLERLGAQDVTVTTRGLRHGVVRWILGLAQP